MSAAVPQLDSVEHVERLRARKSTRLAPKDRLVAFLLGGGFLATSAALALFGDVRAVPVGTLLLLVGVYAVFCQTKFEISTGYAVPTQLVFVPMLLLLPLGVVPLAVAAGLLVSALVDVARGLIRPGRAGMHLINAWHAVGPVLVLLVLSGDEPAWNRWPVYALALLAQFAFDFARAAVRSGLALGVSPLPQLRAMAPSYLVDAALAPLGLLVAFVAVEHPASVGLTLPLVGLLAYFARERKSRIDHALELSQAYRGTALLLGDVVEADDAYTGSHSRDVVELVLGVCDELRLDTRMRRDAEFVALLHDVGKIRIPGEIINKPGPLDEAEWALMKKHTIEGERMLSGVGGLLAQVGGLVRSCHERWDGGGYPDGLAGEEIPLIARIVMACDAYSAMTTDRAYRPAMPEEAAIAELRANAGTQFDARVVDALLRVVRRG